MSISRRQRGSPFQAALRFTVAAFLEPRDLQHRGEARALRGIDIHRTLCNGTYPRPHHSFELAV